MSWHSLRPPVLDLMHEHEARGELPTSANFLFYELEQAGIVTKDRGINPKTGKPYVRTERMDVAEALMDLRKRGDVPWDAVVDETRTLTAYAYAPTVYEFMIDLIDRARINPFGDELPPLILCESRSLAGVLETVASDYVCPISATNGQAGGHLRTKVAPVLRCNSRQVFYLGDYDLSGGHIEANTYSVLETITERDINWRRIAITADQTRGFEPVVKPDKRFRPVRYFEAWETEALGQTAVVSLVRDALEALLPEPLVDVYTREEDERVAVRRLLEETTS